MEHTSSASMQPPNPKFHQYTPSNPQPQNPNPNFHLQNGVYYADQGINPPGVDPNSHVYPVANSGYGLCAYYPDPNAQNWAAYSDPNAQNWTPQQYGANLYGAGVTMPPNGTEQFVTKTSSSTIWDNPTPQPRININLRPTSKKTKTTQSMYCDVCKIVCNTQDVFSKHRLGKKHKKNVDMLKASLAPPQQQYQPQPHGNSNAPLIGPQENPSLGVTMPSNGTEQLVTSNINLKSVCCDVCKVVCDTMDVLNKHKLGKKHKKNTDKLKAQENPSVLEPGVTEKLVSGKFQFVSCEVCKVVCNTKDVLEQHNQGKKHKKNVEKVNAAVTQASQPHNLHVTLAKPEENVPLVGPQENPMKAKAASGKRLRKKTATESKEELEMKRRKLLESGTTVDAVKTCLVCNVICNSDIVFKFHLLGARHNALVKKLGSEQPVAI